MLLTGGRIDIGDPLSVCKDSVASDRSLLGCYANIGGWYPGHENGSILRSTIDTDVHWWVR